MKEEPTVPDHRDGLALLYNNIADLLNQPSDSRRHSQWLSRRRRVPDVDEGIPDGALLR